MNRLDEIVSELPETRGRSPRTGEKLGEVDTSPRKLAPVGAYWQEPLTRVHAGVPGLGRTVDESAERDHDWRSIMLNYADDALAPSIFDHKSSFVLLSQGLNVVYGVNGAGKTHLLNLIASIAAGHAAAIDGFLYPPSSALFEWWVPTPQTVANSEHEIAPQPRTLVCTQPSLGAAATRRATLDGENLTILREFQALGHIAWTVPLTKQSRAARIAVPVCLPGNRGPATEAFVDRINVWLGQVMSLRRQIAIRDGVWQESLDSSEYSEYTAEERFSKRGTDIALLSQIVLDTSFRGVDTDGDSELAQLARGLTALASLLDVEATVAGSGPHQETFEGVLQMADDGMNRCAGELLNALDGDFRDSILFNIRNFWWDLSNVYTYADAAEQFVELCRNSQSPPRLVADDDFLYLPPMAIDYLEPESSGSRPVKSVNVFEGYLDAARVDHVYLTEDTSQLAATTKSFVTNAVAKFARAKYWFPLEGVSVPRINEDVELEGLAECLSSANQLLTKLLPTAPEISVQIGDGLEWLDGLSPYIAVGGEDIAQASLTQQRWVSFTLQASLSKWQQRKKPLLLIVDEPEKGLHRTAELSMAAGLAEYAASINGLVVVATHSPEFLNQPGANLIHVSRRNGIRAWDDTDFKDLEALGLRKADDLARQNLFLIVEGVHDEAVINSVFSEELLRLGVHCIPLHGGKAGPEALDSAMIFDFTDAKIMLLLDNVKGNLVSRTWDAARRLAQVGQLQEAKDTVLQSLTDKSSEGRWMRTFMIKALTAGHHERVNVHGLAAPDVIYYLPAQHFTDSDAWAAVVERFNSDSGSTGQFPKKDWIARTYRTNTSDPAVFSAAAADITVPHPDLLELIEHIRRAIRSD